ncbi:DsrE family protein [Bradyrhizobium sp. AUGA SZCCT0182]|uniref:DsrE family protein n=1 Tax=Bradyrhizobium sp. AUGA SZCCT0182 TaxID=2807667 RepID=UPI001BAA0D86|nr:DsrE family protein [Bradyrhizobium sp. AUGA SZCCT0182]MBR1235391.1 DsrE family protein [Bradyrhizobium sp. AUGA SZCCT0182]
MSMFQYIARVITMAAATVLFAAPFAAAEQGGRYWVPTTTEPAPPHQRIAARATTHNKATKQKRARAPLERARSPLAANARLADTKAHRLILQVNTNDPAAMNLALNNATNVAQYYKDAGEKVKIEVVTFGPGLHMLRDDTSPVKARIEEMALSTPEVSFKACGNTQERMHKAENKDIPIVRQAEVVKSGVVRVMELQEKGWSYVKP